MKHNISDLITQLTDQLKAEYQDPVLIQQTAWWLIEATTKQRKSFLMAQQELELSDTQAQQLEEWVHQLVEKHKPLQYVLGTVPFADLELIAEQPVLIPRPETEEWVINLIEQLAPVKNAPLKILDIGTGTGCIAIALASALPSATVMGIDTDPKAIDLARRNAQHNLITNVTFVPSDVYKNLAGDATVDLIVSNPPYIAPEEWKKLALSVTKWENRQALVAEHEGLAIIERIIAGAIPHLTVDSVLQEHKLPRLIIEIGYQQGPTVKQLMEQAGMHHVTVKKDLEGKDRIVMGRL